MIGNGSNFDQRNKIQKDQYCTYSHMWALDLSVWGAEGGDLERGGRNLKRRQWNLCAMKAKTGRQQQQSGGMRRVVKEEDE